MAFKKKKRNNCFKIRQQISEKIVVPLNIGITSPITKINIKSRKNPIDVYESPPKKSYVHIHKHKIIKHKNMAPTKIVLSKLNIHDINNVNIEKILKIKKELNESIDEFVIV